MVETPEEKRQRAKDLAAEAARHFYRGRYGDAVRLCEQAVAADPDYGRGYMGKSISLAQLGDAEAGLAAAREGIRRDPGYALVYTAAALCLHRLGRDDDARPFFRKALELGPEHPQVLYNYACYWAELGNEDKCREFATRAFANAKTDTFLDEARGDPDLARYAGSDWFREALAAGIRRVRARQGPAVSPNNT